MSFSRGPKIVTDGLVLYLDAANPKSYPGSGTTWVDLSGNGNNGSLINGPTFDSGNFGSLAFDGLDDTVSLNNFISNSFFTIETVVRPIIRSNDFRETICSAYINQGNGNFILNYEKPARIRFLVNTTNGPFVVISPNIYSSMVTTHILGTFDGNTIRLYVDGEEVVNTTITFSEAISASDFRIFSRGISTTPDFGGGYSFLTIYYNRALTPEEVQQNHNALKGRFGLK